jgi:biopolymer transport protein TolR
MGMTAGRGELNSEINVTPLVDVMLVLLVIFMITAPMINSGVELDLPEASATLLDDDGALVLKIDKSGKLVLGETPVAWTELEDKLATNRRVQVERQLYVEADKSLPYGHVVRAMAIAKQAGAIKVMMVTDPNDLQTPLEQLDRAAQEGTGRR